MNSEEFFEYIYGDAEGYFCIATIDADDKFEHQYFVWPTQKQKAVEYVAAVGETHNTYFTPALFRKASHKKDDVSSLRFAWVDFDGNCPTENKFLQPSLRVQTSSVGNEHWYWDLGGAHSPQEVEPISRALSYFYGCDTSAWDAGQLLRVPGTAHLSSKRKSRVLHRTQHTYRLSDFIVLPEPLPDIEVDLTQLPSLEDIVAMKIWPEKLWDLFKKGSRDRSKGMMLLAHLMAENDFTPEEMFVVLIKADDNWGKFKKRSDRVTILKTIVSRAVGKLPPKQSFKAIGVLDFLKQDRRVKWYLPGFIHANSYTLTAGPTGVGKSTMALSMLCHLLLGKDFLGLSPENVPEKVAFFSLEMGDEELGDIIRPQMVGFTAQEQNLLNEKLHVLPLGASMDFADSANQRLIFAMSEQGYTGFIFDTLGASAKNLMTEEAIKPVVDFIDQVRNKRNAFMWFLHHHRKSSESGGKPKNESDIYGSQYITSRATIIHSLWPEADGSVEFSTFKNRSGKKLQPFHIVQDESRHFTRETEDVTFKVKRKLVVDI